MGAILEKIREHQNKGEKQVAILLDPDKFQDKQRLMDVMALINEHQPGPILVGGSLVTEDNFSECLEVIRANTELPLVLFPGSPMQITEKVDATLLLSLISGRNADLLIGQHVVSAPKLKASGTEILPTGYMLVDGGTPTTASYISNTTPIPRNKPDIASCTAMAGEMLGLELLYLDGGSGANASVPPKMVKEVRENTTLPLIVGGGIRTKKEGEKILDAGADMIVIGNIIEESPEIIQQFSELVHPLSREI